MTMTTSETTPSPTYQWVSRARNYEEENAETLPLRPVEDHPLLHAGTTETVAPSISAASLSLSQAEDPLSKLKDSFPDSAFSPSKAISSSASPAALVAAAEEEEEEGFMPWGARKAGILQKYTTNECIGISVKFMNEIGAPTPIRPADTIKQRLEKLEETAESQQQEMMQLSQKEYVTHIEKLHEELIRAWDEDQRVKSLKIAIQCAKVCADTSVIKFYPSKFVLVTEILDTFGKLVFERIKRRSVTQDTPTSPPKPLPDNFTSDMVSENARETCRNWFFKIASIRELIPRIYIEMSIIRCYRFLTNEDLRVIIERLAGMLRGIGDPLVALYARAYLARKGHEIAPHQREYLLGLFYDHLYTISTARKFGRVKKILDITHVKLPEYLDLYSPGSEWLLQCIGHKASNDVMLAVLRKYKETNDALILNHILSSFSPDFIAANALAITTLIREADDESFPKYKLYSTLGVNLVMCSPPKEQQLPILNEVWKVVTKLENPEEYIFVAEVYIEYPLKYFTSKEVNLMLGDILKHVNVDKAYLNFQPQLQSIVQKILTTYKDFSIILGMDKFLPLLDLFAGDTQVEVSKAVLDSFARQILPTADPVVINAVLTVGKIVHDSLNSLSFIDEVRQVSRLICTFIQKIDFQRDVEKQLNFYVDCRRAFANFDVVKHHLIQGVCRLAMKTYDIVQGKHTKKTAAFVRACLAYCFITIPSMEDVLGRLHLYVLAGQVALLNQSQAQAEALLKAAITLIPEVPNVTEIDGQVRSTEEHLVSIISSLAAVLIVTPGHPEHGAFYLIKGLVKVVQDYKWEKGSLGKARVCLALLSSFVAQSQHSFPYHIQGVDSNDTLFSGEPGYQNDLNVFIDQVLADLFEIMAQLKEDHDVSAQKNQANLAMDLFNYIVAYTELNAKTATLAVNLSTLAKQSGVHSAYLRSSLDFLGSPAKQNSLFAQELFKKIKGNAAR